MRNAITATALVLLSLTVIAVAQIQPLAFEVSSIKPSSDQDLVIGMFTYPGGRVTATRYTLKMLIHEAYAIEDYKILDGPAWASSDLFNLEAKPASGSPLSKWIPANFKTPPNEEMRQMLQELLQERFHLRIHREPKKGTIYVLVAGKGGTKLNAPSSVTAQPFVSFLQYGLSGRNATMDQLAERLASILNCPVLNHTNMQGNFDFLIDYRLDSSEPDRTALVIHAVEDQLGLKLETQSGLVDVIVIDHAEKPSEN